MVIRTSDQPERTVEDKTSEENLIFNQNSFDPLDSDFGYERTSVWKVLANTIKVLIELKIELEPSR